MFDNFCTALALECIFMKHGRNIVLEAVMEDCVGVVEVVELIVGEDMAAPPSERLH